MSDRHESWAKVVMARLRETPCRYGFETADAAKIRRQMEREDGAVVIAQLLAEREALAAELAALKAEVSRISLRWEIADHRVSLLWAERDAARREVCEWVAGPYISHFRDRDARKIAAERGWDCFEKEAKP